jgi:uncharacterized protein YjbI with pentapeptide repeats
MANQADLSKAISVSEWRKQYGGDAILPDWANLRAANLSRADLSEADLSGVDLAGADLTGATLAGANLGGANLAGANLTGANLFWTDLSGTMMTWEQLLVCRNVADAKLTGAIVSDVALDAYAARWVQQQLRSAAERGGIG